MSKKYFFAIGQQMAAIRLSPSKRPVHYKSLPGWAREQIAAGYISSLKSPGIESRKSELAALSMRKNHGTL